MTIEIKGKWEKGYALEYHTIGSKYLGEDEFGHKKFETTRTELGKLVYKLKYKADFSVVSQIINLQNHGKNNLYLLLLKN